MPDPTVLTEVLIFSLATERQLIVHRVEMPPKVAPTLTGIAPFVGLAIPPRLQQKVLNLECIEMSELLPESWELEAEATLCCQQGRGDAVLWVECYSFLFAVLAKKHPQHIANFMAYQRSIINARRNFDGAG